MMVMMFMMMMVPMVMMFMMMMMMSVWHSVYSFYKFNTSTALLSRSVYVLDNVLVEATDWDYSGTGDLICCFLLVETLST